MVKEVFTRMELDTGIPLSLDDMKLKSKSLERHLSASGCPASRYTEVYETAMRIYIDEGYGKGPFNMFYLIKAWDEIHAAETGIQKNPKFDAEEFDNAIRDAKSKRTDCDSCKGSRITFEEIDGRRTILYETDDQGNKRPVACKEC